MEATNVVDTISACERATVHVGNNYNTFHENRAEARRLQILQQLYQAHGAATGSPNDYESFKERNPPHAQGTCEWFLTSEQYLQWRGAPRSSFLWLTADAGCGKSVLASTVVDKLRPTEPAAVVCHFFFRDDNKLQADGVSALQALLHQILSARATIPRTLAVEYDNKGEAALAHFQSLWKMFLGVVADGTTNIICILDGLDECESTTQALLATAFSARFERASVEGQLVGPRKTPYIKVFLTTRPLNAITTRLRKVECCRMRGEEWHQCYGSDVQLVIDKSLSELVEEGLIKPATQHRLRQELLSQHNNTFLWVALVMKQLQEDAGNGASEMELIATLRDNSIYALYAKFLNQCVEQCRNLSLVRCFLQIVVAAARPLSLEEMDYALSICADHKSTKDLTPYLHSARESFLKRLGGSFVTFWGNKVRLIHQTAREFLLQTQDGLESDALKVFGPWYHSLQLDEAHGVLAQRCAWYLLLDDFTSVPIPASSSAQDCELVRQKMIKSHPFLHYASHYWHRHSRHSCSSGRGDPIINLTSTLSSTRDRHFWTWFYVFAPKWAPMVTNAYTAADYLGLGGVERQLPARKRRGDWDEQLPLHWAVLNGHVDVLKLLFIFNPNLYILDSDSHTELIVKLVEQCVVSNDTTAWPNQAVEALLANRVSFDGAILWFVRSGSMEHLRYFINRYPDVITRSRTRETNFSPLVLAVMHRQVDIVKALCKMDSRFTTELVNATDYNDRTALDYTLTLMDREMLDCLTEHGTKHSKDFGIRLFRNSKIKPSDQYASRWYGSKTEAVQKQIQADEDRIFQPPRLMAEEIERESGKSISACHWLQEEIRMSRTPISVRVQEQIGMKPRGEFVDPPIWTRDRTPYEILGVTECERSEPAQIRNRYREKILQVHIRQHSTQGAQGEEDATAQFHEIHEAYEILRNSISKSEYDRMSSAPDHQDSLLPAAQMEYACVPIGVIRHLDLNRRRRGL
ncbi:hypothetical protein BJX65DRAFT_315171 [Aspergillus insuetus]